LHDRAIAGAAAITGPTDDQNTERGRHNIKAFGNILADPVPQLRARAT
jgi:hypothetical protein